MEAVKSLLEAGEFDMEMGSSLAECMKPTENIEEKEIVKNEMEAVKSLLEAGGFDMEMDIDRSKSIKFRKLLKKEQSRNINSLEMLIEKSKSEQTPPRNSSEPSRSIKIVKKKQLHNRVLQYKKKLEFPASQSFSLINLHRQLLGYTPTSLHGAEADSLALLRITAMLGEKWLGWANDNCSLISETKCMWGN